MIADGQNLDPGRRVMITIAVMLASILTALDTTIANVALPHIRGSLSATLEQMGWVLTSYIVATAIMTPLAGWLAGQVGRRKVLLISIAGFTLTSALCGIATSLSELVLFRALQGALGALTDRAYRIERAGVADLERAAGDLLHHLRTRMHEDEIDRKILGGKIALIDADVERPQDAGRRAGMAEGESVGGACR